MGCAPATCMMRIIYKTLISVISILLLAGCCNCAYTVKVSNPYPADRQTEMVEIELDSITSALRLAEGQTFVVKSAGKEVPYQITYDHKVIFPVTLKASETQAYEFCKGVPSDVTVKVCGKHYPDREDDICWESDLAGFRVYGFKDDLPSGYDLFTKRNTDLPVIDEMYKKVFDPELKRIRQELAMVDKDSSDRFNCDHISFHVDHGFGADCYGVGKTLGAGVAALVDGEKILYPFCYDSYEILENGPLRFTLKLTFRPFSAGGCENVTETRILSIDLGSYFTRTTVTYANLNKEMPIVTGIVVQDKDGKAVGNAEKGFISYPAPTINYDKQRVVDNGIIFVGHAFPYSLSDAGLSYFSDDESQSRGGSKGHILAHSTYKPDTSFVYYWGFGWNHAGFDSYEQWLEYLEAYADQIKNPLTITLN